RLALHAGGKYALADLLPVCTPAEWLAAQRATESVPVHQSVAEYAVAICRATRTAPGVHVGASPRAAIWLIRSAQAHAVLSSRSHVVPDDVKAVAVARQLLETTPAPRPCAAGHDRPDPWRPFPSRS